MKYHQTPEPSRTGYIYGCRCQGCKDANNAYQQSYRRRQRNNGWKYVKGYKTR